MSYLQDRNKNKKKKQLLFGVVLILILVVLSMLGFFKSLGGFMHIVARPFWRASESVQVNTDGSSYIIRSKSSVASENKSLKARIEELENIMLDYNIIKRENEELKSLFYRSVEKPEFILATILAKPNRSPYDTIVVDIGENQGLYIGQDVFANAEVPIGKVKEVYARSALIGLYSSPGEVTNAVIDGSNISVELIGRGGGNFQIMVPNDMDIVNGSFVVLPNLNSRIVAVVADVVSDPRDPLDKVILRSPVNLQDLKWVQVLK